MQVFLRALRASLAIITTVGVLVVIDYLWLAYQAGEHEQVWLSSGALGVAAASLLTLWWIVSRRVRGVWRGIGFVFGIVIVPLALAVGIGIPAYVLNIRGLPELGIAVSFLWGSLVFPFVLATPSAGVIASAGIPLVQWTVVGAVVGHQTRRLTAWATLLVACGAIVATGLIMRLVLDILGYRIVFEGP